MISGWPVWLPAVSLLNLSPGKIWIPLLRKNLTPYTAVSATGVSMCAQVHGTSVGKSVNPPDRNWYQCCWQMPIIKLLICFSKSSDQQRVARWMLTSTEAQHRTCKIETPLVRIFLLSAVICTCSLCVLFLVHVTSWQSGNYKNLEFVLSLGPGISYGRAYARVCMSWYTLPGFWQILILYINCAR